MKRPEGVLFAENKDYRLGQLSSMQCGLRLAPDTAVGVLFTLVDHPNPQLSTIEALIAPPLPLLAIPRYEGQRGHPNHCIPLHRMVPQTLAALAPG